MANPTLRRLPLLLPLLHAAAAAAASTNVLNTWSIHSLTRSCISATSPCTYALTLSTVPSLTLSDTKAADDTYGGSSASGDNNASEESDWTTGDYSQSTSSGTSDNTNTSGADDESNWTTGDYGQSSSSSSSSGTSNNDNDASDDSNWTAGEYGQEDTLTCTFTLPSVYMPFSALPCIIDDAEEGSGEVNGEYTVSGQWDGMLHALTVVATDGVGEGRGEFGFGGEKAVGKVVEGVKIVKMQGVEVGVGKGMKRRRGEGRTWKILGLTRYPDMEKNETDWQFSILDSETGLEQACLLSSPGSDPSGSYYGIPCDANSKYRISWGHNKELDSAVMTVCYTKNGTDAWFGWEKVSAEQLLGDSQMQPVYSTGCA